MLTDQVYAAAVPALRRLKGRLEREHQALTDWLTADAAANEINALLSPKRRLSLSA